MAFKPIGFTVMAVLLAAGLTACGESDVVEEPSAKHEEATTQLPVDAVVLTINQPVSEGDYRLVLVGVDSDSVDLRVSDRGGEENSSSVGVGDSAQLLGMSLNSLTCNSRC